MASTMQQRVLYTYLTYVTEQNWLSDSKYISHNHNPTWPCGSNIFAHTHINVSIYLCARAQSTGQHVDAGQINIPPQQQPITLSLT